MHILIATSGVLPSEPVAEIVSRLVGTDGRVSVVTVINVPTSFLGNLGSQEWRPLGSEPRQAQAEVIARYVGERGTRLTQPILAALAGRGIEPGIHFIQGEDNAEAIIRVAAEVAADLVVLGATRQIFDESAWESISARVMRDAGRPVLVVPGGVVQPEASEFVDPVLDDDPSYS